ncbi:hypothetical protein [Nitrospira sp. Nam74]
MGDWVKVDEATKRLSVSREFLYKLPLSTPGVHKLGRAKRFDVEQLKAWAGTAKPSAK